MKFILNKHLLKEFNNNAYANGVKFASRHFLEKLNIELTYNHEITNHMPTLVISNHISVLDLLILRAICAKDELYIVILSIWQNILAAIKRETLSVYLSNKPSDNIGDKIRNRIYTALEQDISREDAIKLNKQTISRASDIINKGGSVVMFPSGGKLDQESRWEAGVGNIINQIDNDKAQVIFVNITNTRRTDILKLTALPFINKHRLVNVQVSEPMSIMDIQDKKVSGKEITTRIKKMYEDL